jgi:putative restriction endonuclease
MNKVRIYEMSDVMSIYWKDRLGAIHLLTIEQPIIEDYGNEESQSDNTHLPKRTLVEITRVIRDNALSKELKKLYKNKCQICRKSLALADGYYSEVHHLQPLGGEDKGPDKPFNMIVVCPNHHALLDGGAIAIIPDTLHVITFDGIEIGILFTEADHRIGNKYLRYHFEKRFRKKSS